MAPARRSCRHWQLNRGMFSLEKRGFGVYTWRVRNFSAALAAGLLFGAGGCRARAPQRPQAVFERAGFGKLRLCVYGGSDMRAEICMFKGDSGAKRACPDPAGVIEVLSLDDAHDCQLAVELGRVSTWSHYADAYSPRSRKLLYHMEGGDVRRYREDILAAFEEGTALHGQMTADQEAP